MFPGLLSQMYTLKNEQYKQCHQATSHLLLQGGANAPPWLRQGGHFQSKEGHCKFLSYTFLVQNWLPNVYSMPYVYLNRCQNRQGFIFQSTKYFDKSCKHSEPISRDRFGIEKYHCAGVWGLCPQKILRIFGI